MMDPRFECLTFVNPNKKAPVKIVRGSIAGFDYNKPTECNVIYTIGGVFPVQESLEEIEKIVNTFKPQSGQEKIDVNTATVRQADDVRKHEARPRRR